MRMPDMLADNATKDSVAYGLQWAQYIDKQWMHGPYDIKRDNIARVRQHMYGEVDAEHLKPIFANHGDLSTLSINWKYQSPISKIITSCAERFSYDMYRAEAKTIDMYSQSKRNDFRRSKEKAMYGADAYDIVNQLFGYDMRPAGFVPKSSEELNLYMRMEYKQAAEIAMELGIQRVYDANDWREIFNMMAVDLLTTRYGCAHVGYDYCKGVEFNYVDPQYLIFSRDSSHTRDKRGSYYYAEVKHLTLADVQKQSRGTLTPAQIKSLASRCSQRYATWEMFTSDELEHTVECLYFTYRTNRYDMYKKKYDKFGKYRLKTKEDQWHPVDAERKSEVSVPYEVWYEGVYVVGTDVVFNYGLCDNIMRDPSNERLALPPYILYELSTESIASKLIDTADDLYMLQIKMRKLIMTLRPKGLAVDIDGLGGIEANGTVLSPIDQVRIFKEDGVLLYSGNSLIDDMQNGRLPIQNIEQDDARALGQLQAMYNAKYAEMHLLTGISEQAVGGAPPSRTSQGVYEGTIQSSQTVVNNVFNGLLSIQKRSAAAIVSRLQAAALFDETRPIVESILGEYTTDVLAEISTLHKYQFAVNIDVKPTAEDKARLRQDLQEALQTGNIDLADKLDIEMIDNTKLALQMIKMRQKDKIERLTKVAEAEHARKMEQIQAEQAAITNREKEKLAMETESKMALLNAEGQLEAFRAENKMKEISLTKQWDLKITQVQQGGVPQKVVYQEDRKDSRLDKQTERQSVLIDQRLNNGKPVSFPQQQEGLPIIPNIEQVEIQ